MSTHIKTTRKPYTPTKQMGEREEKWYDLEYTADTDSAKKIALDDLYKRAKELDLQFSSLECDTSYCEVQEYRMMVAQRVESFLLLNGARIKR